MYILGISSSQLTDIFQRGSNHQPVIYVGHIYVYICRKLYVGYIYICELHHNRISGWKLYHTNDLLEVIYLYISPINKHHPAAKGIPL